MAIGDGHRELWLVRHGETPASLGRTLAGWADVPLTERGEAQAAALRPLLEGERFDGVWSSDLRRAARTARLAIAAVAREDRRLREMSFGSLEGRPWETLDESWQQALARFEGFAPPGGETFSDLRRRVLSFVESLPPGRHLVFTHGGVVRLISREVGEDRFVPTGSLLVLDWEARRLIFRKDGEGEANRGLPAGGAALAAEREDA
ncbi:MAG: histidine phosphatase family protein [Betaproteobacteria bacterium]